MTTPTADRTPWTTAHLVALAAPDAGFDFLSPSRTFAAETLRQRLRLRRGGQALRLEVSNEFGTGPLVLGAVTVGGDGSTGGATPVTAGGATRWEVPAGATAVSDPVAYPTVAGTDLVVDLYVESGPPATYLHAVQRTGTVAPGDWVGAAEPGGADAYTAGFWLSRVWTDASAEGPVVVLLGDSITRGDGTTVDADQRPADHLQRRFEEAGVPGAVVLNAGIGGNRLLRDRVGPAAVDRFERDVLAVPEATHVVIAAGLNDLALPVLIGEPGESPPEPDAIVTGLLGLARRAAAAGIRPVLGTLTPFAGTPNEAFGAPGNVAAAEEVNAALRAQGEFQVVDYGAALADPAGPAGAPRLRPAYESVFADGVHPGDTGSAALAAAHDLEWYRS